MIYRTFWSRAAAAILDTVLLLPLILIGNAQGAGTMNLVTVTVLILQHSYYIIGHAQYGQTLGKKLVGVKVVRTHEHLPVTWKHAILRELLWIALTVIYSLSYFNGSEPVLMLPAFVIILSDCLVALVHPQNRSLRDFIAKTVVIRVSPPGQNTA